MYVSRKAQDLQYHTILGIPGLLLFHCGQQLHGVLLCQCVQFLVKFITVFRMRLQVTQPFKPFKLQIRHPFLLLFNYFHMCPDYRWFCFDYRYSARYIDFCFLMYYTSYYDIIVYP